jgi:hypothetical protein
MQLREVDVRFADGIDRRRVVALGDALAGVLADGGSAELVSLSVSDVDLATFAFAAVSAVSAVSDPGPVLLPTPTVGPASSAAGTAPADTAESGLSAVPAVPAAPDAQDCREAVLAAAEGLGLGRLEIVADRVAALPPLPPEDG